MVLVREEGNKSGPGKGVIGAQHAMRLLAQGTLGSRLINLAQAAAAVHMGRAADSATQEAKR